MLDHLVNFIARFGPWGYFAISVVVALECQAGLGFFMPGESLVIAGGFFAERGSLNVGILVLAVSAGAILGDSVGYELGRRLGQNWLLRHGEGLGLRRPHLERVAAFFARHGGKAVFGGHFLHVLRALIPFVAGSHHLPYRTFLLYNTAGCVAWATLFVSVGYIAGESWRVAERWIGAASEIAAAGLLVVVALGLTWRGLVRHEEGFRRHWAALSGHPGVVRLRERLAPGLSFVRDRLSPEGYLGLHLTVGASIIVGASWLFGGIAQDVVAGDPLTLVDSTVAKWLHARRTPGMDRVMEVVSLWGSPAWVTVVACTVGLFLWRGRHWYRLLALALGLLGGTAVAVALKLAFHRPRPSFADSSLLFHGYSFPSAHTMAATLLFGSIAAFTAASVQPWRWKVGAVLGASATVLFVGFSRLYLGAHYLSDVLGAIAAGVAWLALVLTAVDTLQRRRSHRRR